jgi:hypothetical protein
MSVIADALQRSAAREYPRIDYERMNRSHPMLKRALARAVSSDDPERVAETCLDAMDEWAACGAWPDDWSHWQRALDDVLPWHRQVRLEDLRRPPKTDLTLFEC